MGWIGWHVVKIGWDPNSGDQWGVRHEKETIPLPFDQCRDLKLGQIVEITTDPETGLAQILRESQVNCERER